MTKLDDLMRDQPPVPAELCKFRPFAANGLGGVDVTRVYDLLTGRLYFADVTSFNDPFENRPYFQAAYDDAGRMRIAMMKYLISLPESEVNGKSLSARRRWAERAIAGRSMNELVELARNALARPSARAGLRIFCAAGIEAISTPLPWSHYADSHRGVCVHLRGDLMPLKYSFKVDYSDEYPTLLIPRTEEDRSDVLFRIPLRKAADWHYEHEFRSIRNMDAKGTVAETLGVVWDGDIALGGQEIASAITLGALMTPPVRAHLVEWISKNAPHVQVFQADLHERRFEITRSAVKG
jgi:hypothetical protein